MLKIRVIPSLLMQNGRLVKTRKFKKPSYVGDPVNVIRIFNDKEVDELLLLDIGATKSGSGPDYALIEELASECFMPLAYGGGVQTVDQARQLFSLGVEKVCIQTAALRDTRVIEDLASRFGSQSIMASVDIKRDVFGRAKLFESAKNRILKSDLGEFLLRLSTSGVGEVLINAVDKDGTLAGPDLEIVHFVSQCVDVPVIAVGGVSSLADMRDAVDAGASAVAAGAYFVYHGPHRAVLITYPSYSELDYLFSE